MSFAETVFDVPLMRADEHPSQQGFVRVTSLGSGHITITAWDELGAIKSTFLGVQEGRTYHFNSTDLQKGNPAKGIPYGIGAGDGDWYLQLDAQFDFTVTSYVRTQDGFVTAMGNTLVPIDGASFGAACAFEATIFNPATNANQVSSLRIVEYNDAETAVTVLGIDDSGDLRGPVEFNIPASGALTVTAQQLEAGDSDLVGSLGDGIGKWRLAILTDGAIVVMNLLETPTGHLTNLGPVVTPSYTDQDTLESPTGCPGAPAQRLVARFRDRISPGTQ